MGTRFVLLVIGFLPLVACGGGGASAETAAAPAGDATIAADDPRIALAAKITGARPEDLRATPVPGVFELVHEANISYVTADAGYVFSGDLYRVTERGDFPNLSEARRRELRLEMLAAVPESGTLVFGPAGSKYTITVFTDVDCQWCRRLHSQMAAYNKLGIRVRYLFFPRSGPGTESWAKAEAVWCARDRKQALTMAKNEQPIEMKQCPDAPVARDYRLGQTLGVTATPGIVLENGQLVPGYLPPEEMLAHIRSSLEETAPPR